MSPQLEQTCHALELREKERHRISHLAIGRGSSTNTGGYSNYNSSSQVYPQYSALDPSDASAMNLAKQYYSVQKSSAQAQNNRYSDIFAYDRTSLKLPRYVIGEKPTNKQEENDVYLNANLIVDGKGSFWVACQAPIPDAFHPFFLALLLRTATKQYHASIVHDDNTASKQVENRGTMGGKKLPRAVIIVQLTGWVEKGVHKADNYFPDKPGASTTFKPCSTLSSHHPSLSLTHQSSHPLPQYCSTLTLSTLSPLPQPSYPSKNTPEERTKGLNEPMEIHHYAYSGWPDWGVPEGEDIPKLVELVRKVGEEQKRLDCEVWVHCSAGVGRTGAFIALSSLLLSPQTTLIPHLPTPPLGDLPSPFDQDEIAKTIDRLRDQRGKMAGASSQVELVYGVVTAEWEGRKLRGDMKGL